MHNRVDTGLCGEGKALAEELALLQQRGHLVEPLIARREPSTSKAP